MTTITTVISTIFIPVLIPLLAVYIAASINKKQSEREYQNNLRIQRIKLLTLLKKEAELFKEYRINKNAHRSKEFVTTKAILNSPSFNVEDHGKLIELTLEMERINQNIDIAVNASSGLLTNTIGGYINNLASGNPVLALSNSKLYKLITGKTHAEKVTEGVQKIFEKIIEDSTKEALPIIEEIIVEVERLQEFEGFDGKRVMSRFNTK